MGLLFLYKGRSKKEQIEIEIYNLDLCIMTGGLGVGGGRGG